MFEPVCAICSINSSTFSEVLQSLAVRHADRITNSEGPIYFFFLLTKKLEIRSRYLALRIFICYCLQIATAILLFFSSHIPRFSPLVGAMFDPLHLDRAISPLF